MPVKIDPTIERARREVMTARDRAVGRRDFMEMNRLTLILATFPLKRSDGTYAKPEDWSN